MSHPDPSNSGNNYPEDGVRNYPKAKKKLKKMANRVVKETVAEKRKLGRCRLCDSGGHSDMAKRHKSY